MAYYTPGVLELLEAIINPAKSEQTSLPWVIPMPHKFVGKPYVEFYNVEFFSPSLLLKLSTDS